MDSRTRRSIATAALLLLIVSMQLYNVAEATSCVYTFYIRTSSRISGGTDSVISATLFDSSGDSVEITDLVSWGGLMGDGYDYFERGNIDIFSGLGTCTSSGSFCALNITSDGSGSHPGWYVKYVEVTMTGLQLGCTNQVFEIAQWVAPDAYPYQLYAYRDNCNSTISASSSSNVATNAL